MKLLSVTTKNDAGETKLDPNKIVELLIRVVAVLGAIIAWRASQQTGKQTEFLEHQFTPEYYHSVEAEGTKK
jgi:hypothetical protein